MSTPTIPTRHSRSTAVNNNMPQIPPRPSRKLDPSPSRDVRSPLNEPANPMNAFMKRPSQSNPSPAEMPPRPPSVTLPSIGQEGLEYASYDQLPPEAHGIKVPASSEAPEHTRNIAGDMPLHAPKASVPQSTAKSRIETVTKTDSTQAAAAGIGSAKPDDDVHRMPVDSSPSLQPVPSSRSDGLGRVPSAEPLSLRQKPSFSRSSPALPLGSSRPGSVHEGNREYELGIPEIGKQVPLLAMAGDVQAPSPAPTQSQHPPGVGFFNDGSARAHNRKRSGRHEFGPPGSYGMHSHDQEPNTQFERDWYMKNPDKAVMEGYNVYGTPRPATALSSEQLNRMVTQTSDIGMGTNASMIGTPGADIAFTATDEYAFLMASPQPSPAPVTETRAKRQSSGSQPPVESPLRKASFPFNAVGREGSDGAIETEDGYTVHVDPPEGRANKITGGGPQDGAFDFGPSAGNTEERGGWFDERGEGVPILASDEIMKRPGSAMMQPAVPPEPEHHDDYYDSDHGYGNSRRSSMTRGPPSRPSSRPNSMHGEYLGGNLHRFISHDEHYPSGQHTPLEEIEEYEPLIPEEEEPKEKPKAHKKRPGLEHHHFPSQDIWEDTPSSLQYLTTVETPDLPRAAKVVASPASQSRAFETPEEEHKRKQQDPYDMQTDAKTLLKPRFAPGVQDEVLRRPGVQRFPSQDIWEDTPSSMYHVTTVSGPQMDEAKSPPDDRPTTTAIPGSQDDFEARATTGFSPDMTPSLPSRPHRKSKLAEEIKPEGLTRQENGVPEERSVSDDLPPSPEKARAPAIPDRPKPTVPARPARPSRSQQADGSAGSPTDSVDRGMLADGAPTPPAPKTKPVVPARPVGEKIAALKSGFMSDLNNRLKLGPQSQPAKAKEPEVEATREVPEAPLADSRKGRTKGPARRKPAASPSAPTSAEDRPVEFSISTTMTMWSTDDNDGICVPSSAASTLAEPVIAAPESVIATSEPVDATSEPATVASPDLPELEKIMSENEAKNTEEPTLTIPMTPERRETLDSIDAAVGKQSPTSTTSPTDEKKTLQADADVSPADASKEAVEAVEEETPTTLAS